MMDWCRQNKVAVILLVLGIVFLCTGAAQGGYQDAFRKAVRAVSYTHLDVYKRQVPVFIEHGYMVSVDAIKKIYLFFQCH